MNTASKTHSRHPQKIVAGHKNAAAIIFWGISFPDTFYGTIERMNIRFAAPDEVSSWNDYVVKNPDNGNVFQGKEFADQKQSSGWTPRFTMADNLAITILEKHVPLLGNLWYIPKGPGVNSIRELEAVLPHLRKLATRQGVFAIKLEPELYKTDETLASLMKLRLERATPIQPNASTVTVSLVPTLDEVLTGLNQKGRHAINRARRDGVIVKQVTSSDKHCQMMFDLLQTTAAGNFRIRSFEYYKTFWQRYEAAGFGQLFFAYVDNTIVAGAYAVVFGTKSTYKDGASVRERPAYGASHLLQWHVIEWAKAHGALVHDLCGTPPSDEIQNREHSHYGIGRFKTSFNKEVTDYVGAYDCIIRPHAYKLWRVVGERVVLKLHNYRYRENYY
jgi:lipid II:glycine glycyltransferase (peptidoglycan interpeptide bridge formation enzyme)